MTDLRQAAQQALEFLEGGSFVYPTQLATALREALAQPVQEQQQARVDVITVHLMREGINKHKARELADHFVNFTLMPPLPVQEPCVGKDPRCPCQDGDACHYKDCGGTKAWPVQRKPLTDAVLVPLKILEAAASSLDSFCGNLGWGDADLQNMDNLFSVIEQHKAAHNKQVDNALRIAIEAAWDKLDDKPVQEPVACRFCHDARGCWTWQCYHCGEIDDVQQPAAQRPWVGLTDGEWVNIVNKHDAWFRKRPDEVAAEVAKLVETMLKNKNHG